MSTCITVLTDDDGREHVVSGHDLSICSNESGEMASVTCKKGWRIWKVTLTAGPFKVPEAAS